MFPWQSGSNGQEETQEVHYNPNDGTWGPDLSRRQRHVNVAIAYNIWQYYAVTRDRDFLSHYGAEMLLEIARFFDSLTTLNEASGRYEIHGVMGPDEYSERHPDFEEPGLRNNAYTNVMAVWVLERALEVMDLLPPRRVTEIAEQIGLAPAEPERWRDIIRRMTVPFHGDAIISQFDGYDRLPEFDWDGYRQRYGNITRLDRILKAEGDSPDRYKLVQAGRRADAVLPAPAGGGAPAPGAARLSLRRTTRSGGRWSATCPARATARRSATWCTPRCWTSSSTKPPGRCSWTPSRGDVEDIQGGTTQEGVHLGAIGGTVDIVFRHFVGLDATGDVIAFRPRLPETLRSLRVQVRHRGRWYGITVTRDRFLLYVEPGGKGPVPVEILGELHMLEPGERFEVALPLGEPEAAPPA